MLAAVLAAFASSYLWLPAVAVSIVSREVKDATGERFTAGQARVEYFPGPALEFRDVVFPSGSPSPVRAQSLTVAFRPAPAFSLTSMITRVRATGVTFQSSALRTWNLDTVELRKGESGRLTARLGGVVEDGPGSRGVPTPPLVCAVDGALTQGGVEDLLLRLREGFGAAPGTGRMSGHLRATVSREGGATGPVTAPEHGTLPRPTGALYLDGGGRVSAELHGVAGDTGVEIRGTVSAADVDLGVPSGGRVTGRAGGRLDFSGAGASWVRIAESLTGTGSFDVSDARIDHRTVNRHLDTLPLPRDIRPRRFSPGDVTARCARGVLRVEHGELRVENLLFDSRGILVNGSGRISLVGGDYGARLETALGGGWACGRGTLRILGHVTGGSPEVFPDGFAAYAARLMLMKRSADGLCRLSGRLADVIGPPDSRRGMRRCE